MNLDLLDAEVYDSEKQCLTLKGNTAGLSDDFPQLEHEESDFEGHFYWNSTTTEILWDVQFVHAGDLQIAINMRVSESQAGSELEVDIDGEKLVVVTSETGEQRHFKVGSIWLKNTGRITVKMQAKSIKDEQLGAGHFKSLELSGPAAVDTEEDMTPYDIAWVFLDAQDKEEYEMSYTCITPTLSHLGSNFDVLRFSFGAFSLLAESYEGTKIAMCMYLQSDEDGNGVEVEAGLGEEQENILVKAASEVDWSGNRMDFTWNANETYHFLLKANRVEGENSVMFSCYVYLNDRQQWKLFMMNKLTHKTRLLKEIKHSIFQYYYGFQKGYFTREALFGPTWCRLLNGEWKELTSFEFTQRETLYNTDAGIKDNRLFLRTGGHTVRKCELGTILTVEPTELPKILLDIDKNLSVACEVLES